MPPEPRGNAGAPDAGAREPQRKRRRRRGRGGGEQSMVPEAEFRSYYGRPVLKPPVWEWKVPAYLFTGGLSAGSTVLAAGADLTGRTVLRRASRISALTSLGASGYLLVADLGRPKRFHHMLRVAKPTSPMSVGTWILTAYAPGAALAVANELLLSGRVPRWLPRRSLHWLTRLAGLSSAAIAPALASYTAALLSQTAVPAWREAHSYLPFVFTGSAAASGGGVGMICAPRAEAGPARAYAVYGAVVELIVSRSMEHGIGMIGETYRTGKAHEIGKWSEYLTLFGLLGTVGAKRSRTVAVASGAALLAGSAFKRFSVFEAGIASTKDPKYVVVPQRERLARRNSENPEH
jgi:formate-dependent nitrite reductase membrane component NrfD